MNRKLAIIIGLQAFLIVMLFWVLVFYGKDEYEALTQESEEEIETPSRVTNQQGLTIIALSEAAQKQSEIKTSKLKASAHQANISSYGNVIGIDSLIDLRTRYMAAKSEAAILRSSLARNQNEYSRLHTLNLDDKNISDKAVAIALADVNADEAKVFAAESSAKNIAASMQQTWGEALTRLATAHNTQGLMQKLINSQEVLIQITLPFDADEPKNNSSIVIAPSASPSNTMKAYYLSPAPISNTTIQGKTYFYHAKATDLRAGMQVIAILNKTSSKAKGVIIPSSAVIWYGGKPWVYKQLAQDQFSRLPVNTDVEIENGWFYTGGLKPDDLVVTSGAQLLLSEEFKYQITNENED
ncbi:MAG: hypothetical protein CTY33_08265 [Methylotenera sp.]|nr:MAG: hypothetical protein CTY33_08265 [Methylotenera sp.]